ncbi:50S ribosomal protein L1 [Mycoplasmoides pneumoniae]|uniref:Large ribosomal subunit protein uL1 n=4 Tax=Mycoplasmoides pneumoniae TaxID=2104 RepID=RL1_MYCPN|nr:50S ribosomal protein L1 [Mycoplasmoides pneumoniae]P78035.1 RecName: Full=Large ribosomal subunit protein uL1; AltName: Full=50S ribosomal protein L1 [Mycoplasmoides pneumoniae M129]AAB96259.1 ribosomal protein L1 [Mycoplasmoides pneumoniae M129]ADK86720.1 ribosomal protein L1 [Mycoplasmoides pneumoniae FH]AGC04145.1 50S ribosomal protein L1 [Mycoplasmoides pneumoniae M129-B7]ALA30103.1 50S ribosomal protein L1 [Mycoplasmoides pneumoniae PI 1428]ALA31058.1 50S ribosomal protein L1 [Mycopl
MAKLSKKMKIAVGLVDKTKLYPLQEAVDLVKKTSITKFNGSVDIAVSLNLDTTKAEQQLRGAIAFPHSVGKPIRILAITDDEKAALEAGADFVGGIDKINDIKNGWLDFDLIITSPKFMAALGKLGKLLGTKGLMPNPKTETVTDDVPAAVRAYKKGKKEYRADSFGNIHMSLGRVDSASNHLVENALALLDLIKSRKPATVKGIYIKNIALTTTMGPSLKVKLPD